jgi:hypothetical protein
MFRVPGLIIRDLMALITLEFFDVPDGESWTKRHAGFIYNNTRIIYPFINRDMTVFLNDITTCSSLNFNAETTLNYSTNY